VVGARPQFVKLAAIARELARHGDEHIIVHTGQHYHHLLSGSFFKELGIASPDVNLRTGSASHMVQVGRMMTELDQVLPGHHPDWVLVYGDTNSTVAAALAASAHESPVAHVEAGPRSLDRRMPEERNRIVTDHLSALLLAPTEQAMHHLDREGLGDRSVLVGDVMVDTLLRFRGEVVAARERFRPAFLSGQAGPYLLATLHRQATMEDAAYLSSVIAALAAAPLPVWLLAHPRLVQRSGHLGIELSAGSLRAVEPLPYRQMIAAMIGACGLVTDSGGLQKEALVLGVPCSTLRQNTEWPETLSGSWNVLVRDLADVPAAVCRPRPVGDPPRPFGDGRAAARVVTELRSRCGIDPVASLDGLGRLAMKIWILNHYASPPDRPAGTRHYELGRVLSCQGHEVTVFASSFSHFSRREERLGAGERVAYQDVGGVRFVWIRTTAYTRNDHRRVMNMLAYSVRVVILQRRMPAPDVVVGSSVHPGAVLAAWLISRRRRAGFVVEVRDLWPQTLIDMGALREDGLAARALRCAEAFFYRQAASVICLLPRAPEYLTSRGVPPQKLRYIPNGIDDFGFHRGAAAVPEPTGAAAELAEHIRRWRKDGFLVAGYVGSHGPANGVLTIIEAAAELHAGQSPRIAVVLVGDGQEKRDCQDLASRLQLDNVLLWPPVPKTDVPGILAEFDAALFCLRDVPVFRYGLSSNKLFDYLASGRPVVFASSVADNPVRESGGGVCVPAGSPAEIARALVALADMGETGRLAMGERGRDWVYEHHGTTALAARFLSALGEGDDDAVAHRRGRRIRTGGPGRAPGDFAR